MKIKVKAYSTNNYSEFEYIATLEFSALPSSAYYQIRRASNKIQPEELKYEMISKIRISSAASSNGDYYIESYKIHLNSKKVEFKMTEIEDVKKSVYCIGEFVNLSQGDSIPLTLRMGESVYEKQIIFILPQTTNDLIFHDSKNYTVKYACMGEDGIWIIETETIPFHGW